MRAAIYCRVSSDPNDTGRSVEDQEAECRAYCGRQGWSVGSVFVDNDRSASRHARRSRPDYRRLIEHLQDGAAEVLVMWEGSRAQRDLADFVHLRDICAKAGILYSYSGRTYDLSRTDDRFSTGLDALLAEREADITRDRILRATRSGAAAGRPHGKLLYGYRRTYDERGRFVAQVIDDEQAAVIREAAARVRLSEPCQAVAKDLNRRGIPAPRGGQWDLTQIRRIVTNPAYVALRVHQGRVVGPAQWPAILDEQTHTECVSRMIDPRRRTTRDMTVKWMLTGAATCAVCDGRLRVQKNRGFRAYLCVKGFHVSAKTDQLDEYVSAVVIERLSRPDVIDLLAPPDRKEDAARAADEATALRARLDEFYEASARGEVSPAGLARIEGRLLPQIEAADQRARTVRVPQSVRTLARPDIAQVWGTLPIATRREVVSVLMEIRIHPVGAGRRIFNPDRVEIIWRS